MFLILKYFRMFFSYGNKKVQMLWSLACQFFNEQKIILIIYKEDPRPT